MQDRPTHTASGFDLDAWREGLLALNPWARGLTIDDKNEEFTAVRQKAALARHAAGKEEWNAWAGGMLAAKSTAEKAGVWRAQPGFYTWRPGRVGWEPERGENVATQAWLFLARAAFSTESAPHRFEAETSFSEMVFPDEVSFHHATFGDRTRFTAAVFDGSVVFRSSRFVGSAHFQEVEFCGVAQFQGATFADNAHFQSSMFRSSAWFQGASFGRRTSFHGSLFKGNADFEHTKIDGPADFAASVFRKGANFEGVDSGGPFSLSGATFDEVPSFFGATFKGVLRLDNVKTPRYPWLGYTPERDAKPRFAELRRRAVEAQDRGRELEFFAQEFRTGRFHSGWFPSWVPKLWQLGFWLGLTFEGVSDFGRSLWRPLFWWLALAALFAAFYLGEHDDMRKARADLGPGWSMLGAYTLTTAGAWFSPPPCRVQDREPFASTDAVTEAIQLSLRNALVFDIGRADAARRTYGCLFGLEKDGEQQYLRVSTRVSTASTAQALASGLLIFLFLLAVRNLLRLK